MGRGTAVNPPRIISEADFDRFCETVRRRDRDMIEPVRGSTDARRTTAQRGSSCEAAIQQTKSRRSESAPSLILSLLGPMVSGKNQVQLLFRKGQVQKYPNKTFTNWRQRSHVQIMEQLEQGPYANTLALVQPVHLTVDYWPADKRTRDITGMADALFHLLVYAKVLQDDGLIRGLVWREHDLNRKYPKLLMELRPL